MGTESTTFYKGLADQLSNEQGKPYFVVMGWLRCCLSFVNVHSAIIMSERNKVVFWTSYQGMNLTLTTAEGFVGATQIVTIHCIIIANC